MKIEHLAIWVDDLEQMKDWYCQSLKMSLAEKNMKTSQKASAPIFSAFPLAPESN